MLVKRSPILQEAEILSANLSIISVLGVEAIQFADSKKGPPSAWKSKARAALDKAKEQGGRCDLQIVSAIRQLVDSVK